MGGPFGSVEESLLAMQKGFRLLSLPPRLCKTTLAPIGQTWVGKGGKRCFAEPCQVGLSKTAAFFYGAGIVTSDLAAFLEVVFPGHSVKGLAHFTVTMKWSTAFCWTLILLAACFFEGISAKGGRGGARGAARGSARGSTRRSKPARYSSSGGSLRVAAAAAGGAAAGASVAAAGRMRMAGEGSLDNADIYSGNSTGEGSYNYRAWTSGAQPWHFAYLPACLFCLAVFFSL